MCKPRNSGKLSFPAKGVFYARIKLSAEEIERKEKLYETMQSIQIGEARDLKNLFRDTISDFLKKDWNPILRNKLAIQNMILANGLEVSESGISPIADRLLPIVEIDSSRLCKPYIG